MQSQGPGGRLFGRRLPGRLALVLLAVAAAGRPAPAQDADPFTATVAVDASAENAAQARELARTDGQRRALMAVIEHLNGGNAPAKPLKLDDKAIADLVASFEVANERMSAVRYVADYTFHFRPAETRRLLGATAAAAPPAPGAEPGRPMVLLPVYQSGAQSRLWEDPNPWREAWDQSLSEKTSPRVIVPLGDAGDISAIDADRARAGNADALAAIARRNGGDDALVALATLRGPDDKPVGVDLALRRYRAGKPVDSRVDSVSANPGEDGQALLHRAALAVIASLDSGWKKEAVPSYDQQGSLIAVLPITGLDDWVRERERLATVPAIRKVALMALSRQEATIEIGYVGSIEQLKAALAGISLDLVRRDPGWQLARSAPTRQP